MVHNLRDQPLPSTLFEAGLLFAVTCTRLSGPQAAGVSIYASLVTTGALATGGHYRVQPYKGFYLIHLRTGKNRRSLGELFASENGTTQTQTETVHTSSLPWGGETPLAEQSVTTDKDP